MSDIDNDIEELNHIIGKWQICEFCKIVDDDRNRTKYGHICNACGKESNGGQMYFDMSVHLMIDLIKEAFITEHKIEHKGTKLEYQLNTHYISVLLFFCTLRETLLNGLITDLCSAHKGASWDINRDTAIDCIKSISPLMELYVALNNKYVHSKYGK